MADYVDLPTLKLALGITDGERDALLEQALAAASQGIDRMTGRSFSLDETATQREYGLRGRVVCDEEGERLLVDDIGSASGLIVESGSGSSWSPVTGYLTAPDNALMLGQPITSLLLPLGTWGSWITRVRITARWGWPEVPADIAQAALIQATRLYKRKDSPEGVMGSAEWGVVRVSRIDPDVAGLVAHFTLPGFG